MCLGFILHLNLVSVFCLLWVTFKHCAIHPLQLAMIIYSGRKSY